MKSLFAAAVALISLTGFAAAAGQAPVAVVEDMKGKVTGAELMDYVVPGKVIKLGAGASRRARLYQVVLAGDHPRPRHRHGRRPSRELSRGRGVGRRRQGAPGRRPGGADHRGVRAGRGRATLVRSPTRSPPPTQPLRAATAALRSMRPPGGGKLVVIEPSMPRAKTLEFAVGSRRGSSSRGPAYDLARSRHSPDDPAAPMVADAQFKTATFVDRSRRNYRGGTGVGRLVRLRQPATVGRRALHERPPAGRGQRS